jgi:hypothetical protein
MIYPLVQLIKENLQLVIILMVWLIAGVYGGPLVYAIIPATILIFKRKNLYLEMLIGFWLILILSDNLTNTFNFAKQFKNIYIVLLAIILLINHRELLSVNNIWKRFIPFFFVAIIALYDSESFAVSVQKTISYILIFLVVPNYLINIYKEDGDQAFKKIIYFSAIIVLVSLLLKYVNLDMAISHGGRYRGIFGNPNGLAIFCLVSFLFTFLIDNIRPGLFYKRERLLIYGMFLLAIYLSGSRNVAVAVTLFFTFARLFKISPFLGTVVFIITLFLYELIGSNYILIIKSLGLEDFFRLKTLEAGGGRYIAWNFAWNNVQHNLFLGKGFAFDEYLMRKNYAWLSMQGHEGGVHNSYLILWLNTGIIGVIVYFRSFFLSFIKGNKNTKLAYPVMFAVMFSITFEPWLMSSLNPYTIGFLLILTVLTEDIFYELPPNLELEPNEEKIG